MKYIHLLFDLDRTLWDFDANSNKALIGIFHDYRLDRYFNSAEEFLQIYYTNNDILWEQYRHGKIGKESLRLRRFEVTLLEKQVSDTVLAQKIGERYMEVTPRLNILAENTIETLEYLAARDYRMYILTNGFLSTQEIKMAHSNIDGYFKKIYSSEEIGVNKPRKEIFHWAVTSIHAKKSECLMIGDDLEVDIMGAMNYGIDAVWYNPENLDSGFQPTYTIRNLLELTRIL